MRALGQGALSLVLPSVPIYCSCVHHGRILRQTHRALRRRLLLRGRRCAPLRAATARRCGYVSRNIVHGLGGASRIATTCCACGGGGEVQRAAGGRRIAPKRCCGSESGGKEHRLGGGARVATVRCCGYDGDSKEHQLGGGLQIATARCCCWRGGGTVLPTWGG